MNDILKNPMDDIDLLDVYAASSQIAAERIVLMLQDQGLQAECRESSVSGFPSVGTARFLIVMPANQGERAKSLIEEAIRDEVIPGEGTFLVR
jgi:hypothetical protein